MYLTDKTVLITGAGGAIGAAIAKRLADDGAQIVLNDINEKALRVVGDSLGSRATLWPRNLKDTNALADEAASMAKAVGGIDILVNSAGILSNNKIDQTSLDEWRDVHAVNVETALVLIQSVLPAMRSAGWGRIINMASYAARSGGLTAGTSYSSSKAAMIGLTFSVAREVAGNGICVNAIAPAYVISPMVLEQLTDEQRQRQLSQVPVGRFCEPEEVAHAVSFLASPLAGFITGTVIDMNGGMQFG